MTASVLHALTLRYNGGMMKEGKLEVGDIVVVSTVLGGIKEYPVLKVDGNKATTKFREFSAKIYPGGNVYEFGKRPDQTTNGYWLKEDI